MNLGTPTASLPTPAPSTHVDPVGVFIDDLKSDDIQLRLNAVRNLSTIAKALGPDRAQKELLPFLKGEVVL